MGFQMILFLATTFLATCHAEFADYNPIRLPTPESYGRGTRINCQSFLVGNEANNLKNWKTVPSHCKKYITSYFTQKQYKFDLKALSIAAVDFAKHVPLPRDLRTNVFVFDLDETLLSNLDYLTSSEVEYGTLPLNYTALYEWIVSENATAPALPAIKTLYDAVLDLGFKPVILSESPEYLKDVRISHLKEAGYSNWEDIIFRGEDENDLTSYEFKYKKLRDLVVNKRYRIIATIGDQWSDLTGARSAMRAFKVPNPLYYVA